MWHYDEMKATLPGIDDKIAACPKCKKCKGFAKWKSGGLANRAKRIEGKGAPIYYDYCGGKVCHHQTGGRYAIYLNDPHWSDYLRDGGTIEEILRMKDAIGRNLTFVRDLPPETVAFFRHRSDKKQWHKRGVHGAAEIHSLP